MSNQQSFAELKAFLKQESEKRSNSNKNSYGQDIYPFWSMNDGSVVRVRLLEDADPTNPYKFYKYKFNHKISINGKERTVPCLHQYGEKCPICELSAAYYKSEGKESKNGKYYFRKRSAIVRMLVIQDPLPPNEETGETFQGKVVRTFLGNQLLTKINALITDEVEPMDSAPWDLDSGYDFIIRKSRDSSGYATYDLESRFASKSTRIPDELREQITPVNLSSYIPENPGFEKVDALLNAHLNGGTVDEHELSKHEDEVPATTGSTTTTASTSSIVQNAVANSKGTSSKSDEVEEKEQPAGESLTENDVVNNIMKRYSKK